MTISLYDLSVATYRQILGGVHGFMEKGRMHCIAHGIDLGEMVETRIYPDMRPFRFQITSVVEQSMGAIEAIRSGRAGPSTESSSHTYAELQQLVQASLEALEKLTPAEINGYAGKDVTFAYGEYKLPFTAEGYVLSFSLPNFYFHATTAYDILRGKGVPLGKGDFIGNLRLKS